MENSRYTVLFQCFPFTQNHTQNCKNRNRNRNLRGMMVGGEGSTPNKLISAEHFTILLLLSEPRMDVNGYNGLNSVETRAHAKPRREHKDLQCASKVQEKRHQSVEERGEKLRKTLNAFQHRYRSYLSAPSRTRSRSSRLFSALSPENVLSPRRHSHPPPPPRAAPNRFHNASSPGPHSRAPLHLPSSAGGCRPPEP